MSYKSIAKLGVISAQAIQDGTYNVEAIFASKPKNGYCNPLVRLEGYKESLYVHPTKLGTDYCTEKDGLYTWELPQNFKNLKVVINAGTVTLSFPDAEDKPAANQDELFKKFMEMQMAGK